MAKDRHASGGWGSMPRGRRPGTCRRLSCGVAALHHSHTFKTPQTNQPGVAGAECPRDAGPGPFAGSPMVPLRSTTATPLQGPESFSFGEKKVAATKYIDSWIYK